LATHTSGLARLPANFDAISTNQQNPYANYRATDLYQDLAAVVLTSKPGTKSDYSNYGFGLLGHVLALKAGKPYEALVKDTVCHPLEMRDTTIQLLAEQRQRLTPGHNPQGELVSNWDFDVLAPAGAFRSTAADLLKFVEANLAPAATPLGRSLTEAQRVQFETWSDKLGLAWQIEETIEGLTFHWHNGGTGGYASFIGFDKTHQTGVVILSNYGDAMANDSSVDEMGMELLRLMSKISWD
jgi:CubicO group peptidase (beta-lactamase class C family)